MAIKTSTGLRNTMVGSSSLRAALNLGFIKIYAGAVPATADDAVTGTLLVTISNDSTGTGLTFEPTATNSAIGKAGTEIWSGINVASGVATHYRHVAPGDTGLSSTTQARVQGTIDNVGADMNMTNVALIAGATQSVDYYLLFLPTL